MLVPFRSSVRLGLGSGGTKLAESGLGLRPNRESEGKTAIPRFVGSRAAALELKQNFPQGVLEGFHAQGSVGTPAVAAVDSEFLLDEVQGRLFGPAAGRFGHTESLYQKHAKMAFRCDFELLEQKRVCLDGSNCYVRIDARVTKHCRSEDLSHNRFLKGSVDLPSPRGGYRGRLRGEGLGCALRIPTSFRSRKIQRPHQQDRKISLGNGVLHGKNSAAFGDSYQNVALLEFFAAKRFPVKRGILQQASHYRLGKRARQNPPLLRLVSQTRKRGRGSLYRPTLRRFVKLESLRVKNCELSLGDRAAAFVLIIENGASGKKRRRNEKPRQQCNHNPDSHRIPPYFASESL